jgi:hypothetical protein
VLKGIQQHEIPFSTHVTEGISRVVDIELHMVTISEK